MPRPCSNIQTRLNSLEIIARHQPTNQTPICAHRAPFWNRGIIAGRKPSTVIHLSLSRSRVLDHCQLPSIEPSRARASPFSFRPTRNALPISFTFFGGGVPLPILLLFFFPGEFFFCFLFNSWLLNSFDFCSFFSPFLFFFFIGFSNGVCRMIVKQFVGKRMIRTTCSCVSTKVTDSRKFFHACNAL